MRNRQKRSAQQVRETTSTSIVPDELGKCEAIPDATDEASGTPEMLSIVESRSCSLFLPQYCGSPLRGHWSSIGKTSGELRSRPAWHQPEALTWLSLKMSTTTRAMPVSGWQSNFSLLLVQQGNSGISRRNARHSTRVRPLVETLSVIFSV